MEYRENHPSELQQIVARKFRDKNPCDGGGYARPPATAKAVAEAKHQTAKPVVLRQLVLLVNPLGTEVLKG